LVRPYPDSQGTSSQIEASVSTATPIGIGSNRDHTNDLLNNLHENLESFFKGIDQKSDTLHIYQTLININKELENIRNALPN